MRNQFLQNRKENHIQFNQQLIVQQQNQDQELKKQPPVYSIKTGKTINKQNKIQQVKQKQKQHVKSSPQSFSRLKKKQIGITIPKSIRNLQKKVQFVNPGPCQYEPQKIKINHAITFPKSESSHAILHRNSHNYDIGPGSYTIQQNYTQNRKSHYTIGTKYDSIFQSKSNNKLTGPGSYQVQQQCILQKSKSRSKNKLQNKGFGTSNRFSIYSSGPGPADYESGVKMKLSINKKRTISNVGRDSSERQYNIPGPGDYNKVSYFQQSLQKNKGKTIGIKVNQNIKTSLPSITNQSFNKYNLLRQFDSVKGPAYSIGHQIRKLQEIKDTPGPNQYKDLIPYKHSPSATFGESKIDLHLHQNRSPGPGTYEANANQSTIKYTFTKSKSINVLKVQNKSPGVGNYQISDKLSKVRNTGSIFSKQKRLQDIENNLKVGVGDYNINSYESHYKSKGYTIPKA